MSLRNDFKVSINATHIEPLCWKPVFPIFSCVHVYRWVAGVVPVAGLNGDGRDQGLVLREVRALPVYYLHLSDNSGPP